MTDGHGPSQDGVNIADRTAIIVAGVAIGVSLFVTPGFYGPTNILIGMALIVTLHAADSQQDRNRFQSASFALAWALSFLLIAGLFVVNPYIHLFTDKGEPVIDHFTFIEFPHFPWIEHTFKDQASDTVSFCVVGIIATIWYMIRRLLFTFHQHSLQLKESAPAPSESSPQVVSTSISAEKRQ